MGFLTGATDWLGLSDSGATNNANNTFQQQNAANTTALQGMNSGQYSGDQNNDYTQQQGGVNLLGDAARGNVPSAADIQMQQGQNNGSRMIQSAALSNQGGMAPGLTQRNMLNAQSNMQDQMVGQGAAMRAQEQATARQQYAQALQAMRGQSQNQEQWAGGFDLAKQGQIEQNNQAGYNAAMGTTLANTSDTRAGATTVINGAKSLATATAPTPDGG